VLVQTQSHRSNTVTHSVRHREAQTQFEAQTQARTCLARWQLQLSPMQQLLCPPPSHLRPWRTRIRNQSHCTYRQRTPVHSTVHLLPVDAGSYAAEAAQPVWINWKLHTEPSQPTLFAPLAAQALPPALARQGRLSNDQLLELSHWSPLAEQGSIWESHSSGHVTQQCVRSVGMVLQPDGLA